MALTDTLDVTSFEDLLNYAFVLLPTESRLEDEVGGSDWNALFSGYQFGDDISKQEFKSGLGLSEAEADEMHKLWRQFNTLVGGTDPELLYAQTDPEYYGGQMENILRGERGKLGSLMGQVGRQVGRGMITTPIMEQSRENIQNQYLNTILGGLMERGKGMSQAKQMLAQLINDFVEGAHGVISRHEYQ